MQKKPWFVWWNGTRMHFRTHVKKERQGISGQDNYGDGMVEHDRHIGQILDGYKSTALDRDYKVHLDGYDMLEHFQNPDKVESPRKEVFYFSDDGDLAAMRYGPWKLIFMEQRMSGTLGVWGNPFTPLRMPLILNLRRDP